MKTPTLYQTHTLQPDSHKHITEPVSIAPRTYSLFQKKKSGSDTAPQLTFPFNFSQQSHFLLSELSPPFSIKTTISIRVTDATV